MKSLKLKDGLTWIGALDPDLKVFDIIMYTEFGTTYNSYVLKGSDKIAIIETVKVKFFDDYLEKLREVIDPKDIDYIIVDHTEPDHVGSVARLLDLAPNSEVIGSQTALRFLKAIVNKPYKSRAVADGDEISLGDRTLQFISAPFLHWPDSMYTYSKEDKVLFTCDSFGSHYCLDDVLYSKVDNHDDYNKALKYYFDMIMGPFKPHMLQAIAKIEPLDIEMICTGHGPVLDKEPMKIVDKCKEWSTESNPNKEKTIIIPFVSAYGYTATLAEEIKKGIASVGNIHVESFDMVFADKKEVMSKIRWADGLLLGSPTINSDALPPIWDILMNLSPIVHGKKFAAAFGSYGWSGEAVPNLEARLKQLRMKVMPGLKINFKPEGDELKQAYEFGVAFAKKVLGIPDESQNEEEEIKSSHPDVDGKVKKWKCVICGEIFEGVEPPEICPACGATTEQFEVHHEEVINYHSDAKETIVIIGNGAAGTSALEAIRARNQAAKVIVVSNEEQLAYYRPMLSDYISNSHDESTFYLHDAKWYEENNIELRLGMTVSQINVDDHNIELDNGERISYNKLIIATGSHCFVPPIKNTHLEGVFTIKNIEDANRIKAYAKNVKKVVIVGGGLLGLEAAWELKTLGLEVYVIEVEDRILPRQLDDKGSVMAEKQMKDVGIHLTKGTLVEEFDGEDKITAVKLNNGDKIEADMAIISTGVRPDVELAKKSGIEVNKGIVVDEKMKTNVDHIYAAGDNTEFKGVNYTIWPEALQQGKVAGANAVGDQVEYSNFIPSHVFNGMDMNIYSIGAVGVDEQGKREAVTDDNSDKHIYKKLVFEKDKLVGGILIGDISKTTLLLKGVNRKASKKTVIKEVF